MAPELEALAQRLEDVEKQVAHLASLVTELSDKDRTVTARRFVVQDENGNRKAELGTMTQPGKTGPPFLGLFDDADARVLLGLAEEGPMIQLTRIESKGGVHIGVDEHGPQIEVQDVNGKRSVSVIAKEDGPHLALFDPNDMRRLLFTASPVPGLFMYDPNGKLRVNLQATLAGDPVLVMYDGDAEPRLHLELSSTGEPLLQMCDATGDIRVNLSVEGGQPSLKFGKDNKVHWSAPTISSPDATESDSNTKGDSAPMSQSWIVRARDRLFVWTFSAPLRFFVQLAFAAVPFLGALIIFDGLASLQHLLRGTPDNSALDRDLFAGIVISLLLCVALRTVAVERLLSREK